MINLHSLFNIASIVIGFVSAICFCNGALSIKSKDIALASATIVDGNPTHMHSLSTQKAQQITGAIFLIFSFGLQAAVVLVQEDTQIPLPPFFQSPIVQILIILLVASAIAFLAVSHTTTRTEKAAQQELRNLIEGQSKKQHVAQ